MDLEVASSTAAMVDEHDFDEATWVLITDEDLEPSVAHEHCEPSERDNREDEEDDLTSSAVLLHHFGPRTRRDSKDDEKDYDLPGAESLSNTRRSSCESGFSSCEAHPLDGEIDDDPTFNSPPQSPHLPPRTAHPALLAYQHGRIYIANFRDLEEEARETPELLRIVNTIKARGWIAAFDKAFEEFGVSSHFPADDKAWTLIEFVTWWDGFKDCLRDVERQLNDDKPAQCSAHTGVGDASHEEKRLEALSSHSRAQSKASIHPDYIDWWEHGT